ncbi:MAG: metal-sulfur cluster assembly factor [Actinomycetota bacterium]|nr:metal-sulfur cluster assembly factor [Actinomycetota bacterium]
MSHVTPDAVSPVEAAVLTSLEGVADPCCRERGISVVDMGLLRRVEVVDGTAHLELLLTSGWCPFQVDLLAEVTAAVEALPGVDRADVRIMLDEVWTPERMGADARRKLRFLPDPVQVRDRAAYRTTAAPTATP